MKKNLTLANLVMLLSMACANSPKSTAVESKPDSTGTSGSQDSDQPMALPTVPPGATFEELLTYLKAPFIPPEVQALGDQGREAYTPGQPLEQARQKNISKIFAGRKPGWIKATFTKDEDVIVAELAKIPAPQTWTIAEIDKAYEQVKANKPPASPSPLPEFFMVKDFGVNELPNVKLARGIAQLASQANYLESPGRYFSPVSDYIRDRTQGPAAAVEAAAAALHRTAAVKAGTLPHALHRILPLEHQDYYTNGYFEPWKIKSPAYLSKLRALFQSHVPQMEILVQWVMYEPTGIVMLQVFSFAPAFQGASRPDFDSDAGQICDLFVSAQYEAIAKVAVIMSEQTAGLLDVPVHFTLVGQSAFKNPEEVMKTSFDKVAAIVRGYPKVRVFIHAYDLDAQESVKRIAKTSQENYTLPELTKEEFINLN